MKVLLVGAAGYVASIVRPTLEERYDCRYFDRFPVPGRKSKTIVADVLDERAVRRAVRNTDVIVYSALGLPKPMRTSTNPHKIGCNDTEAAFRVNAAGWFEFAYQGLRAGVRRFVYVSSLSVYHGDEVFSGVGEDVPSNAFYPYGFSKRAGEHVCDGLAQASPKASVISLRLMAPRNESDFEKAKLSDPRHYRMSHLGPNDTRRLFTAAIDFKKPGHHWVHATSDVTQEFYKFAHAKRLLGWEPRGE